MHGPNGQLCITILGPDFKSRHHFKFMIYGAVPDSNIIVDLLCIYVACLNTGSNFHGRGCDIVRARLEKPFHVPVR
jgi:hypothetical protein